MFLSRLQIFDFKNHKEAYFELCNGINCFTGANGAGKTNLLDAVYYLANAKSAFNGIDGQLIRHGAEFFSLHGWWQSDSEFDILATFSGKGKKNVKKNGKTYQRLLEHIGLIQTVFITPYDISLVLEGSEERRRFVDFTLCQTNKEYLETLSLYKRIQEQRNAYLKQMDGRIADPIMMESFDERLIPAAEYIHAKRKDFIENFIPVFQEYYAFLSNEAEVPELVYESEFNHADFRTLLIANRDKDRILQRTSSGVHKDDFVFNLNGYPLKKYGSQGQTKSFVIALKLAQYRYFMSVTGQKPILLLDDIFEKIDAVRAGKLMELVAKDFFGQILITDTHAERVQNHLAEVDAEKKFFEIAGDIR